MFECPVGNLDHASGMCCHVHVALRVTVLLCTLQSCTEHSVFISSPGCPEANVKAAVYTQLCTKADFVGLKNVLDWDFSDAPVAKT